MGKQTNVPMLLFRKWSVSPDPTFLPYPLSHTSTIFSPPSLPSTLVFPYRLSGAVIKGYEQDVGTRTSFYGFTAFSVVQSILKLSGQGFQHVPLGKVRREEWAWPHSLLTRD